jgi:hypothetical protein
VIDVVVEIGDNVISHQTIPVAIFGGDLPDPTFPRWGWKNLAIWAV